MPTVTQAHYDALVAEIANLNAVIAGGERQVVIGDQSVTFNTTASLMQARDDATRRLQGLTVEGVATVRRPRPRQTLLTYGGRGY